MANEAENQKQVQQPQIESVPTQQLYAQFNILFSATQVELPPAEKYNAFPLEAQRAILEAFKTEQKERHQWLSTQQGNDHELNKSRQKSDFILRIAGVAGGFLLALAIMILGAVLVLNGASITGVALLVTAVGGLVGTAIYGHKLNAEQQKAQTPSTGSQLATR